MSETLATIAGLRVSEVPGWASRHGLTAGRFGRYPRCEVETLLRAAEQETRADAQWARMVREPRVAVLLDTETSDLPGSVCEIAVVDCASGETLLDTLVNPGVPITSAASKVHGITDGELCRSCGTWLRVLSNGGRNSRDEIAARLHGKPQPLGARRGSRGGGADWRGGRSRSPPW